MTMRLVPLGVNGYLPANGCQTSCYLCLFDRTAILLDAGTGAARLGEPRIRELVRGYDTLHILLSHYHVDHTMGLYYVAGLWEGPLVVYGPSRPFIDADPQEAVLRLFRPPLNSFSLADCRMTVEAIREDRMDIGGVEVRFWPQRHPGGSVGMRIGGRIAYLTDTVVMPENAEHARGVDTLLHELWLTDQEAAEDEAERGRHSTFTPLADFIKLCTPRRFFPVHLNPRRKPEDTRALCERLQAQTGVETALLEEGRVYEV
jgi:ribonuclease BN (tRNA processing enzyme)